MNQLNYKAREKSHATEEFIGKAKALEKYLQFLSRICRYCAPDLFRYVCPVCTDSSYMRRLSNFRTDNSHSGLDRANEQPITSG